MTTAEQHPGAILVLDSRNAKLGQGCAATYVSPATCPETCPLRGSGCYAEEFRSYVPGLRKLMNSTTAAEAVIDHEARLITHHGRELRVANSTAPLRLHVMGDVDGLGSVMLLAWACRGWPGAVWTYTHRWRTLLPHRSRWGRISVLASIDHFDQAAEALALGYAPAIVVGQASAARFDRDGVRWTHCPAQRDKAKTCTRCRLCWHADKLLAAKRGIVFETHGQRRTKARIALEQCVLPFGGERS